MHEAGNVFLMVGDVEMESGVGGRDESFRHLHTRQGVVFEFKYGNVVAERQRVAPVSISPMK